MDPHSGPKPGSEGPLEKASGRCAGEVVNPKLISGVSGLYVELVRMRVGGSRRASGLSSCPNEKEGKTVHPKTRGFQFKYIGLIMKHGVRDEFYSDNFANLRLHSWLSILASDA